MMRVGVVGDIHGNEYDLKQVVSNMGRIDQLLFTGDGSREMGRLAEYLDYPVSGVRGNCDYHLDYPVEQTLYLEDCKVLLTHGHMYNVKHGLTRLNLAAQEGGYHLVVFGHTHQPLSDQWNGIQLFNPGSLSRERSSSGPSYGMIEIKGSAINAKLIRL